MSRGRGIHLTKLSVMVLKWVLEKLRDGTL